MTFTTTTQAAFHPMRGHVDDGVTVKMNDGSTLTIRPASRGWKVVDSDGSVLLDNAFASELTQFIVSR